MSCVGDIGGRPNYKLKAEAFNPEKPGTQFPYEAKDEWGNPYMLVLGPDTYASLNGESILWREVTYRRENPVLPPDPLGQIG